MSYPQPPFRMLSFPILSNSVAVPANWWYTCLGFSLQVLLYDHRGVVKSGPARMEQQTSLMLARDALALLDHVWGPNAPLHVYG